MAMDTGVQAAVADMPTSVQRVVVDLVEAAQKSFQDDLASIVLFGSAAEGRLRATSDLNLLIVLKQFQQQKADQFCEPLRLAHVAARAAAMFVLESELPAAAEAFAVKFGDIARRCRVLFGDFPVSLLEISAEAKKQQLRRILMNLSLRLRQSYVLASLREEQLAIEVAEAAGPLRAAAATLQELEGRPATPPKESLETVAGLVGGDWKDTLNRISEARESRQLPHGVAAPTLFPYHGL